MIFFQAVLVANLLGMGMNAIFSETELRRYPLTAVDRLVARHLIAILDPFWFVYLAFYLGLALGLFYFGAGNFLTGTAAALLLFLCNYAAAQAVGLAIERLTVRKAGTEILIAGTLVAVLAIALAAHAISADASRMEAFYPWLRFTPGFAAAKGMTQVGFLGPLIILAWSGALIPAIAWMERHPPQQSRRKAGAIVWDTFFDRVGERFGPRLGPLVAFWLRFNCRNTISRRFMWLAPAMFAFLTFALYNAGQKSNPQGLFLTALGALPLAAFMASGRIVLNQFGYMGGGFRRLLLLPVPPSSLIWSASFTSTILSFAMALLCLTGWVVAAPFPFDLRMIAMLVCSALTGLLLLQSASVWATVYNPSRSNYFLKLGNDLSLGANAIFVLGAASPIFVPGFVHIVWPEATSPETWSTLLPLPALGGAVYLATLAVAGWALARRREKVMAVVEGKR